jgi:hypothetical protein
VEENMKKTFMVVLLVTSIICIALTSCGNLGNNPAQANQQEMNNDSPSSVSSLETQFQGGVVDSGYYQGAIIYFKRVDGMNVFQGDIVLADSFISKTPPLAKTSSAIRQSNYWPNGNVFYTVDANFSNPLRVTAAVSQWATHTNLYFAPRYNQANYIRFERSTNGATYSDYTGMLGGEQHIYVADWASAGDIIHEIGHNVGLFHEQSRTDRDSYVKVCWNNINQAYWDDFRKFNEAPLNVYTGGVNSGSFDFNSIMLYGCYTLVPYCINQSLPIMTKLDGTTWTRNLSALSVGDMVGVNTLYSTYFAVRGDRLLPNDVLWKGISLRSQNGKYCLVMQYDGNLVTYNRVTGKAGFSTNTYNKPVIRATMQSDGNFVLRDVNDNVYWYSCNSPIYAGSYLIMQNDGNVVIYKPDGTARWASNTINY